MSDSIPPQEEQATSTAGSRIRYVGWAAVLLLLLPVLDLVGGAVVRHRVPVEADWEDAAAYVRGQFEDGDLVVPAPDWADSLVYEQLGDLVPLAAAGRSDDEAYRRVWVLSIRGHVPDPYAGRPPAVSRTFGGVTVLRWDLGESSVIYSFMDHLRQARVEQVQGSSARLCPWTRMPWGQSGLHWGSMFPRERFQCDRGAPHLFVGEPVNEDLELRPRHCIWQHPQGRDPIRATFRDVPLGERLVFYGGIYYQHERVQLGGVVDVELSIDGVALGSLQHRDGDGWTRQSLDTEGRAGQTGTVSVAVSSESPRYRSFCWSGYTAGASREEVQP